MKLSSAETKALLNQYAENRSCDLRNKIVEGNLHLVDYYVGKYSRCGVPSEDIRQEAYIGLMTAIDRYDPQYGTCLSTFAKPWIMKYVLHAVKTQGPVAQYMPDNYYSKISKIQHYIDEYQTATGKDPSDDEIMSACKLSPKAYLNLYPFIVNRLFAHSYDENAYRNLSVDDYDPAETEIGANVTVTDEYFRNNPEYLTILTPDEREAIVRKYGFLEVSEQTIDDIAEDMHIGANKVKGLIRSASKKIKDYIEKERAEIKKIEGGAA